MSHTAGIRLPRLAAVIGGGMVAALVAVATATATPTGGARAAGAVPSPITDDQIAEAGLGVMAFNLRNITVDPVTEPCPVLAQDQLGWYLAQQGYAPNFTQYLVDIYYEDDVGEGYPGVDCVSDVEAAANPDPAAPHYPVVGAAYLPDGITFLDFLGGFQGQTLLTPAVSGIGGEVGGVCIPTFCYLHWHRGSLVISVLVAGGRGTVDDITLAKTEALLIAMVPDVVANLMATLDLGMTATTTAAPTTTAAVPTTVVAATTTAVTATAMPTTTVGPSTTVALPALPERPASSTSMPTKTTPA